jgi:CspA family cold shock protein
MPTGTVKFYNDQKGFGFITPDDGGKEVFVHTSGLTDDIREKDKVSYDVVDGKRGPTANNVTVIG